MADNKKNAYSRGEKNSFLIKTAAGVKHDYCYYVGEGSWPIQSPLFDWNLWPHYLDEMPLYWHHQCNVCIAHQMFEWEWPDLKEIEKFQCNLFNACYLSHELANTISCVPSTENNFVVLFNIICVHVSHDKFSSLWIRMQWGLSMSFNSVDWIFFVVVSSSVFFALN